MRRLQRGRVYAERLRDVPGISTYDYDSRPDIEYNYAYFPVKVTAEYGRSRDELWAWLKENGIGTRKLYDKLTCDYACYKDAGYVRDTGYADRVKDMALDLPLYGTLTETEIEEICDMIKSGVK